MIWGIIFVMVLIGAGITIQRTTSRMNIMEEFYTTSEYKRLWNLLEDCTLINKDFPIMRFQIEQGNHTQGYFQFLIEFRDLGMCAIAPQQYAIEITEREIKRRLNAELAACDASCEAVRKATDRAFRLRSEIQSDADDKFFKYLFNGQGAESRDFFITSPFESYASSGGSYIVDTDYWNVKGNNAIYTGLLYFEYYQNGIVLYAIENTAKKMFPNVKVSRFTDGCYIYMPLR